MVVSNYVVEPVVVSFALVVCEWFVVKGRVVDVPDIRWITRQNALHVNTNSSGSVRIGPTILANHVGLREVLYRRFGSFLYVGPKQVGSFNHIVDWTENQTIKISTEHLEILIGFVPLHQPRIVAWVKW